MDFSFKDFFSSDEMKYSNRYLLLHPFYSSEQTLRITTIDPFLDECIKWETASKKYNLSANINDLFIAFEIYYYGLHYFENGFGENESYINKNILPLLEKIKSIPKYLLPEGERLPKQLFKEIFKLTKQNSFSVEAEGLVESGLNSKQVLDSYNEYLGWNIKALSGGFEIAMPYDSMLTKIVWDSIPELDILMKIWSEKINIIKI